MPRQRHLKDARAGKVTADSLSESSDSGWCHRKQPVVRQQRLNSRPDPQGQRSFRPSFSSSTLSPWTTRNPRLTCVSDGNPRRRLLIVSMKGQIIGMFILDANHGTPPNQLVEH
jgi:hypothetical protein